MLSMFKRKPKPVAEDVTIAEADAPAEIIEADIRRTCGRAGTCPAR